MAKVATRFYSFLINIGFAMLLGLTALFSGSTYSNEPTFKIGVAQWTGYPENIRGFKAGLRLGGLDVEKDVIFIEGVISSDKQLQQASMNELKRQQVDLLYSLTTPGTIIAKSTFSETTPIVFSIVTYPADSGLIESFEYSGNNLVGTSNYIPLNHHVKLLKLLLPRVKNVAIFHRKGEPNSKIQTANMTRLLRREGVTVWDVEASNIEELKSEAEVAAQKVDVFITTTDTLMQDGGEEALIEIAKRHQTPILSSNKAGILAGSTFGPVSDFYTLGEMSGQKAAQILLEGKLPSHLSTEFQDVPVFLINTERAKTLGVTVPTTSRMTFSWTGP